MAAGVELDNKGRIVIDDQFNTSVKGIRHSTGIYIHSKQLP